MGSLEIITVNYNTPDLVERMVKSIREHEGDYIIHVVDGSDDEHPLPYMDDNVLVHHIGWNIHHGRGLDYALNNVEADWCLLIDSDNYIKKPIIEKIKTMTVDGNYIVGHYCHTDKNGNSVERGYSKKFPIQYWHPSFMLINVAFYKHIGVKFIHHGAPAIEIAKYLDKLKFSPCIDIGDYLNEDINDYVFMEGEGTVKRWGYNL